MLAEFRWLAATGTGAGAFDADVVVIGIAFGGATTALRLTEAGHRVLVLEKGRRQSVAAPWWGWPPR